MKPKTYLFLSILGFFFGCDTKEHIGGHYYLDKKKNEVVYRYSTGGSLLPNYKKVPTGNPKTFNVLSDLYAVDNDNVFFAGNLVNAVPSKGFEVDDTYPNTFAKNTESRQFLYQNNQIPLGYDTFINPCFR